jgi:hypothetical protein
VNTGSLRLAWSARVYTIALAATLALAAPAPAQTAIAIEPMMTKGAMTAPVTIVEYSDYQ